MPARITLELPASSRYLNVVGACVRSFIEHENGLPDDRESFLYQTELAVHEVCINIIEHAYAGAPGLIRLHLTLEEQPHQLIVDLYDSGSPFDASQIEQTEINPNEPKIRGYGLFLIHELMDDVTYTAEPGRNHWRLKKTL